MELPSSRPSPDALLAEVKREERRSVRGKLRVFFGMCPGVGKTYAMLREARRLQAAGSDVVVAVVETHGRQDTEHLLEGLTVLPRIPFTHQGIQILEMDLEGLLSRRPKLALVDELAHTNPAGSRHPKRYQDVIEILEAGIDVFTTLNVQHVESRADAVRQITGVVVQETLPDSFFDYADQIELIDLSPESLKMRLKEGKVYLGQRAERAAENFFRDTHLTALRELALRFVAERVDTRLRELRGHGALRTVWRSGERLIVAVGPSPTSKQLIRWTRRMAAANGSPWIAVSVESSRVLSTEAQRQLERNLALAEELGAEVLVTHDEDVAKGLVRTAIENQATQIVVGKSQGSRILNWLQGGSLVDRILRHSGPLDVYVVPSERLQEKPLLDLDPESLFVSPAREYYEVGATLCAVTVGSWFLVSRTGYLSTGLFYLLAVIILSLRVGRWPVLLAGITSALTWNFLFIPPIFTFVISKFEDGMMFASYIVVSLVAGQLTARVRAQAKNERLREERATALFNLTQSLAGAETLDEGVFTSLRQADRLFNAKTGVLLADERGTLTPHYANSYTVTDKELGVAEWAYRNRRPAGRFTDTLPSAEGYHIPLNRDGRCLGLFIVHVPADATLTLPQRDLAGSFAGQIAQVLERENFRLAQERERALVESEKLHRALLDSVSHELRTPLSVINGAVESLKGLPEGPLREELLSEAGIAVGRLNRLVGNLLDQTRLESGTLKPRTDWCDAADLANAAVEGLAGALAGHRLTVDIPSDTPLLRTDPALMEQVLANLLLNAAAHTPADTAIFLTAGLEGSGTRVFFTVSDNGPGFPASMKERLFQKFQRGDAARAGGLGLGLSIVRGFVSALGGEVVVGENPGGGAVFTVYLPHQNHGDVPLE